MKLLERYKKECLTKTDIHLHLPTLYDLCKDEVVQEKGVYECGFRTGVSTWAFLASKPAKVLSIDINSCDASEHKKIAKSEKVKFSLRKQDSKNYLPKESPFGLSMIDTLHEYKHLYAELEHISKFTEKYIVIHDTDKRFEKQGRTKSAINDFVSRHKEWAVKSHTEMLHGLTVLEKTK
ncbi:MAG: class I SAM-dependent methyltransferase [Flavobacteriales bacterium]|nr:class I SAM-dependent methyltransferase [Flavobacteriales bacterium]